MAEDWDCYLAWVDDHSAMVFVDLGQIEHAPDPQLPWLVQVTVALKSGRDDGLADEDETEELYAVEDALFATLSRGLRARYVGRVTTQGQRTHYYYAQGANDFAGGVAQAMAHHPQYEYTCRDGADEGWESYINLLYPSDLDMQSIQNRRLVDLLVEQGDDLSQPRDVDHWLYFPSEESRDQFLLQIAGTAFQVDASLTDEAHAEFRYALRLTRQDRVDLESIDGLVSDLLLRARECGGEYDGWESAVVSGE
ncbi:MAG: DUF695 domain-containing protein [Planctomycetales bacterium]